MNFVTKIALRKRGRPPIGKVAMTNAERQRRYRAKQRRGVHFSSKSADWSTPQSLYDQLDSEFGFELDVCATAENAKCERFYSLADNGLAQPWTGTCFCNPPYGAEISLWLAKARDSALAGATVVALIPCRTDTKWWHSTVMAASEIRYLPGRLHFGGCANSAPFPSAVVVWRSSP
jgi:phage N-6-adenine-methyltransferase